MRAFFRQTEYQNIAKMSIDMTAKVMVETRQK